MSPLPLHWVALIAIGAWLSGFIVGFWLGGSASDDPDERIH